MSRPTLGLDADYLELRAVVREVAEDRIAPHAAEVDDRSAFPEQSLKALVAARLHTLTIPAEYGGEGADRLVAVVAAEEVARVCATTQQVAGSNELFVLPLPTGTPTTDTGRTDPGNSYRPARPSSPQSCTTSTTEACSAPGSSAASSTSIDTPRDLQRRLFEPHRMGYRRIHGELAALGIKVAPSTVWEILKAARHRACSRT
ncbi:acyl-CoA dehydrogenase family protein [Streptomyces sp. NBC_00841]|uniref:acyl-CoA dehydrogenase family protein n=1 Tax=Streptomyces sp. NBC_00841 TaxID=2975847 RepID=UPI002DD86620|nr:acyl-CoA dehydrogenase family protein [Streptomyces sp. NBC_00841]